MHTFVKSSLFALALGIGASAIAQTPSQTPEPQTTAPQHQPSPKRQAKELAKRLGLTADQTARIEPILADRDQRLQTLQTSTNLDQKTLRQQRRALMMDTDQKLNAVLTPAQQQQWAELKSERRHGKVEPAAPPATAPSV
jgi:Spy/CpxP family protein refolding chaperone